MFELIVRVFAKNPNPEKKDVFLGTAFLINDQFLLTARHSYTEKHFYVINA